MALMQPWLQAVPHTMAMPGTKQEMDPTGVGTSDPASLTKAFTN